MNSKRIPLSVLMSLLGGASPADMYLAAREFSPITEGKDALGAVDQYNDMVKNLTSLPPEEVDSVVVMVLKKSKSGQFCDECQMIHETVGEREVDAMLGFIGDQTTLKAMISVLAAKLAEHEPKEAKNPLDEFLASHGFVRG